MYAMLERNTRQVNRVMARIFLFCSSAPIAMTILTLTGVFEFETVYALF